MFMLFTLSLNSNHIEFSTKSVNINHLLFNTRTICHMRSSNKGTPWAIRRIEIYYMRFSGIPSCSKHDKTTVHPTCEDIIFIQIRHIIFETWIFEPLTVLKSVGVWSKYLRTFLGSLRYSSAILGNLWNIVWPLEKRVGESSESGWKSSPRKLARNLVSSMFMYCGNFMM